MSGRGRESGDGEVRRWDSAITRKNNTTGNSFGADDAFLEQSGYLRVHQSTSRATTANVRWGSQAVQAGLRVPAYPSGSASF